MRGRYQSVHGQRWKDLPIRVIEARMVDPAAYAQAQVDQWQKRIKAGGNSFLLAHVVPPFRPIGSIWGRLAEIPPLIPFDIWGRLI
jgi:hypothetical protein